MMSMINDEQLGVIELKRYRQSKSLRLKIKPDGTVAISAPFYMPLLVIKRFIAKSRINVIEAQQELKTTHNPTYQDRQLIGKSHRIVLLQDTDKLEAYTVGQLIRWSVPAAIDHQSVEAQKVLRPVIDSVLRKQAKQYLPKQLAHLAHQHGFSYSNVRFGNAKGRWGSCSSSGTISLNIALMNLPNELIDYVLIHELCHTKQMNHSDAFWSLVRECLPSYKIYRKQIKSFTPYL